MAANLTIGSVSIAAGGKIVTATISGGTGTGYAPASGVTGITVVNSTDGQSYNTASATISGNTLTVTLKGYVATGKTVTFTILSSSNLTDSGSNTAQGQSGVAITNSSTMTATNFAYNHAGVGRSFGGSNGSGQGAIYIETILTGTDANLRITEFGTTGKVYASIDGGAETLLKSITVNSGTTFAYELFAGLANTTHDVTIRCAGSLPTLPTTLFQTTSSSAPTLPSRYGPSYSLVNSYVQTDGVPVEAAPTINGFGGYLCRSSKGQVNRFRATISTIRFSISWVSGASGEIILWRRASGSTGAWTEVGTATDNNHSANENYWSTTITGLDSTQEWEYAAVYTGIGNYYFYGFGVTGGSGVNTATLSSQGYDVWWGDSITAGYGLTSTSQSYVYKVSRDLGRTYHQVGSPGELLTGAAVSRSSTFFTSTVINNPALFIAMEGVNDNINESSGSTTTFQTAATNLLSNAFSKSAKGFVFGILPDNVYATHPRTDAAWAAAVATQSSKCGFYSSDGVVNALIEPTAGADKQNDGTGKHPNDQGNTKIATFLKRLIAPLAAPTGYTVGLSANTGAPGVPITITYTRASGTNWITGESVTTADGSDGTFGAFTHTNGTTATRTYTPGSGGLKTLTHTNSHAWTNPDTDTFTSDLDPPMVSGVVGANGTSFTGTFNETVVGTASGFTFSATGGAVTLGSPTLGSTTITGTLSRTINQGETVTWAYSPGDIADPYGNAMQAFTDASVTNNSTQDTVSPAVPGSVAALAGNTIAKLSWSASSGGDVAGYQYRLDGGSSVDVGLVLFKFLDTLTNGTTYSLQVRAYDEVPNYSSWSDAVTFTPVGGNIFVID